MSELSSEAILDHLEGLGRDIAERRHDCLLRILALPGMTPRIFEQACLAAGAAVPVKVEGGPLVSWPKCGDVSGRTWHHVLEKACAFLGTTPEENDERLRADFQASETYKAWQEGLRRHQQRHEARFRAGKRL